jgi:putative transposase
VIQGRFWESRFYDFNIWSFQKRGEKLNYMRKNPAVRGLVAEPDLWMWSSDRFYRYREKGMCTPDLILD